MNKLQKVKNCVRNKEEFAGISEDILDNVVTEHIKKNKLDLDLLSEKDIKIVIKDIRNKLRDIHGRFQISVKNRDKLVDSDNSEGLLRSHLSTKERINIYPDIVKLIFSLKPKSIIDIASGLNPIALANDKVRYLAIDINHREISLLEKFFQKNNINGKAICADVRKVDFSSLPNFDICLIFKFLDFVEDGNKLSEFLINNIRSKYFITSFATKSISGKGNRRSRRIWFERILKKLNHNFEIFEFDNEIFYLSKVNQTTL